MITKTDPYKHQVTAFNKAYKKEYFALFMEMGTGKTKVSVDIASNLFNDMLIDAVLVVAPNTVHEQWAKEEIPKHCSVDYTTFIWKANKSNTKRYQIELNNFNKSEKLKFFCVNIETFSRDTYLGIIEHYLKNNRCLMIVDESSSIKTPDAGRTKAIIRLGLKAKYKLALTGTPVTNSPFDLWSQFEYLKEGFFGCIYFVFKHKYGLLINDTRQDFKTGKVTKYKRLMRPDEIERIKKRLNNGESEEDIEALMNVNIKNVHWINTHDNIDSPYKSLNKLKNMIDPYTFIVKKDDCLDLPSKIYEPIYIEMSTEQKKIYKEAKKLMLTRYGGETLTIMNKLTLMLRLQQITGGFFPYDHEKDILQEPKLIGKETAKFKRLALDLEEVDNKEKIIIWCKFSAEIKYLQKELRKLYPYDRIETYYGGTNKGDRENIISDFKNGEIKILIANPASAGIGLNLQRSSLHYYYSNDFSLEKRLQSEDRSHRIGQKNHVVYKDIIIKGSIDDLIVSALAKKKNLLEFFREKSLKELLEEEIIF